MQLQLIEYTCIFILEDLIIHISVYIIQKQTKFYIFNCLLLKNNLSPVVHVFHQPVGHHHFFHFKGSVHVCFLNLLSSYHCLSSTFEHYIIQSSKFKQIWLHLLDNHSHLYSIFTFFNILVLISIEVLIVVVVQSLSHVRLSVTPWSVACQASLSFTISLSLLKLMSIESVRPSNHFILCCPLLLPSIFPSTRYLSVNRLSASGD